MCILTYIYNHKFEFVFVCANYMCIIMQIYIFKVTRNPCKGGGTERHDKWGKLKNENNRIKRKIKFSKF